MNPEPPRLVVLISGNGSNMQAVLDACSDGRLAARVVAVISNQADAYGLERARSAEVPALALPKPKELDRRLYDRALAEHVAAFQPDYVLLLGWMRLLSSDFLNRFPKRVINLHPALPGSFPGTHSIERAFQAYQDGEITHTGVMLHLVPDEGVDSGPVLGTVEVPILSSDSLEGLEARVHQAEHRLVIEVLQKVLADPSAD
jgi:phosphoribosylglycinamide formyltransferase 1